MDAKSRLKVYVLAFLVLNMVLAATMPLWSPARFLDGVQPGLLRLPINMELTLRAAFGGACAFLVSGLVIGLFTHSIREAITGCVSFSAIVSAIGFIGLVLYESLSEKVLETGFFALAYFGFITCVSILFCTLGGMLGSKFRERLKIKPRE